MNILKLLKGFESKYDGKDNLDITSVTYDSRKVSDGSLFFCIEGFKSDGHDYAAEAVKKGARALMVSRKLDVPVPQIIVADGRAAMARMSANFYGYPCRSMKMIGVTGTNGKTTTTYLVRSIVKAAGKKAGIIGTIANVIGDTTLYTDKTTPESPDLQKLLRDMVEEGVEVCAMEVSSHSLELKRVEGITFDVGIFTNLTQDHLDFHGSLDKYKESKAKLFQISRNAVINADDRHTAYMTRQTRCDTSTFGIVQPADIFAKDITITAKGCHFKLCAKEGTADINLPIPGRFSVYNALSAAGACLKAGFALDQIAAGLCGAEPVPGRIEVLPTGDRDFTIILDYAHTPDGLVNVLSTVRSFARGRVVTLFGCGGDRDKTKRPMMGEVAGRHSDYCILTSDNPRTEEPMQIIKDIVPGVIKSGCGHIVIENRREAIKYAIDNAKKDDIIVLAGKGHETYQERHGVRYAFDEKKIVGELLKS